MNSLSRHAALLACLLAMALAPGCSRRVADTDINPAQPAPSYQPEAPSKSDQEQLQGIWIAVGTYLPGASIAVQRGVPVLTFDGKTLITSTHTVEGQRLIEKDRSQLGTFVVDQCRTPKTIDVTLTRGPAEGQTLLGIYAVRGTKLALHLAAPNETRPDTFADKHGTFLALQFEHLDPVAEQKAVILGAKIPAALFLPDQVRSARRVGNEDPGTIYLNLMAESAGLFGPSNILLVISGEKRPLDSLSTFLKERLGEHQKGGSKTKPTVALRADRSKVPCDVIARVMAECLQQGMDRIQWRVWPVEQRAGDFSYDSPAIFGPAEGFLEVRLNGTNPRVAVTVYADRPFANFFRSIEVEGPHGKAVIPRPEGNQAWKEYPEGLEGHLKVLRGKHPNLMDIAIKSDPQLEFEALVRVTDACVSAGFTDVRFVTLTSKD